MACLGTSVYFLDWSIERQYKSIGNETDKIISEECARKHPRANLRIPTNSGSSGQHYQKAIDATYPLNERTMLWNFFYHPNPQERTHIEQIVQRYQSALMELERGAREGSSVFPRCETLLNEVPSPGGVVSPLIGLGLVESCFSLDKGDSIGAIERIVDVLQFSRDWADVGAQGNAADYGLAIESAKFTIERFLSQRSLQPETLERLAIALKLLDEFPPNTEALLMRCLARTGAVISKLGIPGILSYMEMEESKLKPGWRHMYSERRLAVNYFQFCASSVRRARGCNEWTAAQERDYLESLEPLPHACKVLGHPLEVLETVRSTRSNIRLLRIALQWASSGECIALSDPWGTTIRVQVTERSLRAWSVGKNGRDEGGGKGDLVVEVSR